MTKRTNNQRVQTLVHHLEIVLSETQKSSFLPNLSKLELAAEKVGKASSGSWLGYQAFVYYKDFADPDLEANFSPEYGLMLSKGPLRHYQAVLGTTGNWCKYSIDEIRGKIFEIAENNDLASITVQSKKLFDHFDSAKNQLLAILESESSDSENLQRLHKDLADLKLKSEKELITKWDIPLPAICRDSTAYSQGRRVPPHVEILLEVEKARQPFHLCQRLSGIAQKIASHLTILTNSTKKRQTKMDHEEIQVDAILDHCSKVSFNEGKNRFEASATNCKNIGYGATREDAMALLSKIVRNKVNKRDELENLENHEAYNKSPSEKLPHPAITNVYNVHGVLNTGSMQDVSISVHQSISNLEQKQVSLASDVSKFVSAVEQNLELPEQSKSEILDRADALVVEAVKPADKRLMHRITDNLKGIGDTLKGMAALKVIWDVAEASFKIHFGL